MNRALLEHWPGHRGSCFLPKASLVTKGSKSQGKCWQRGERWDQAVGPSTESLAHLQGRSSWRNNWQQDSKLSKLRGFPQPEDQSGAGVEGGGKQEREGPVLRSGWQELKLDGKQLGSLPRVNEKSHISLQTTPRDKSRHRICFRRSKGN